MKLFIGLFVAFLVNAAHTGSPFVRRQGNPEDFSVDVDSRWLSFHHNNGVYGIDIKSKASTNKKIVVIVKERCTGKPSLFDSSTYLAKGAVLKGHNITLTTAESITCQYPGMAVLTCPGGTPPEITFGIKCV